MAAESDRVCDPFVEAKWKLFPPLRNRILAEAAGALAANRVVVAESLVARFLEKKPRDPDALNLMADIARRAKRFEEAGRLLSRCVKQSPDCAGYRFNYAVILRRLDKYEEALAQLDELLNGDPRNPLFRDQKAAVLVKAGRHDEALAYRRELAEEFPGSPDAWLHYGHSLRGAGFQDRCIAAYRKALELAPSSTDAYGSLADLKIYRFTEAEIAHMEAHVHAAGSTVDIRSDLHHALGTAYEDKKRYDRSYDNYAKSNALRRMDVKFDPERLAVHRVACESFLTEAFFRERAGWGCSSAAPIFIVGMPRSGSTLVEQILSSHTAIEALGELAELDLALVRPLPGGGDDRPLKQFGGGSSVEKIRLVGAYLQLLARLDSNHLRVRGEAYLELAGRRRTTARPFFTDKTLSNFFYAGLIHLILPNAKIIDIRRHPLDCGWSCFKSQFAGTGQNFSYRLGDIGHYYANYVKLMAHFDSVLPERIHRVIYEELVADPEAETRRLLDYLGLPFEENCLRFHENRRTVATLSSEQVRMPLYKSGIAQWLPYEPWLGPLKSALGSVLDCYPDAPDGSPGSPRGVPSP
ncbi:MAG: tetratricopeptide repeat-containing sulfotransferase family protein [Rhizomicrobium sp.]